MAGRSGKTDAFKEKGVEGELGNEGPVSESRVELEFEEDEVSRTGKARRSSEVGGLVGYRIAKLDK